MMRKLITFAALNAYILLVAFLFSKSANDGAEDYAKIEKFVRTINQRNSDLDSSVLSLRLGLVKDYDELSRCELDLARWESNEENPNESMTAESPHRKSIGPLIDQKVLLTADFKASHSVVRNSVALSKTVQLQDNKLIRRTLQHARKLLERRIELDRTIETLVAVPIREETLVIMDQAASRHQVESRTAGTYRAFLLIAISLLIAFCIYQYVILFKHKAALHEANASLERRVKERTAELAETNGDLEAAIAKAEKLALVARYTDNAVVITDENAIIEWVNDGFTRITGYQASEVIGKPRYELLHGPDTCQEKLELIRTAVESQNGFDVMTVNYRKNDEPYWVEIEARPIKDRHEKVHRYISIENDVTDRIHGEVERQNLNEQLIDASRIAGMAEMATGVLHNVGNILNSVNVSTDLIRNKIQKTPLGNLEKVVALIAEHESDFGSFIVQDRRGKKIPEYIAKVTGMLRSEHQVMTDEFRDLAENVDHIKKIISVQQSMAKTSGWRQELSPAELVNDSIVANKGALTSLNVKITREIEPDLPVLISDKHKILQILVNLVKNANDAMLEHQIVDPEIAISVRRCEDSVVFDVADNGVGIAADHIDKIFNHGFTTKESGHGFGLHSSANAASAIGGSLSVTSAGIGKGASFQLSIPLLTADETICQETVEAV